MVLFTKLLTKLDYKEKREMILSMVLFTKLLTQLYEFQSQPPILSMVLFTKLLTLNPNLKHSFRF